MPATDFLIPVDGDLYRVAPSHTVYTRAGWYDDWTEQSNLYANMVRWGSGPVRSAAELEWRYGAGMQPDDETWTTYAAKDLNGHYLRIDVGSGASVVRWYGILTDSAKLREGIATNADDPLDVVAGRQVLTAEGLDLLLSRAFIVWSPIRTTALTETEVFRGLTFNAPNKHDDTGNRNYTTDGNGVFRFTEQLGYATWWSSLTILQNILFYHSPRDRNRARILKFELSANAMNVLPNWDRPIIKSHGRTVRSILNEICDRRRMLTWSVNVPNGTDAGGVIEIDVHPFNKTGINIPSGEVKQPNASQIELGADALDISRAVDARVVMRESIHHKTDRVVVRGAKVRTVVSFGHGDSTLDSDWQGLAQTKYQTKPPSVVGLTDVSKQQAEMRAYRAESELSRVFTAFRLPATWDGKVGNGADGIAKSYAWEGETIDGAAIASPVYMPDLRFERTLPKEIYNYGTETSPRSILPPVAIIKTEEDSGTLYRYLDELKTSAGVEGYGAGAGREWSASMRVDPDLPGIRVRVQGGDQGGGAHLLAKDTFSPLPNIDKDGELDWRDMIITVALEMEAYVEQAYPAPDDLPADVDAIRTVYFDIGDRGRLDYLHPAAVVGIQEGELRYTNVQGGWVDSPHYLGTYLRDDRVDMLDLARFIYEWYAEPREAFDIKLTQLTNIVSVGDLITKIGAGDTAEQVAALVTGVTMNLRTLTSDITTGFAELDPSRLI